MISYFREANKFIVLLILLTFATLTKADDEEEALLLELYGGEELVSIATGTAQPISKAPAVASVITAKDIKEIGARDIDDVLETVPGATCVKKLSR